MTLGPHADFIVTAYAVTIVLIAGLIAWVAMDYQAQRRMLGKMDKRGVKRRSRRNLRK